MSNNSTPGVCKQRCAIAPGSKKWVWIEWPKRELGTATISSVSWDLPAGLSQTDSSISGRRVGICLNAASGVEHDAGWLVATITTSDSEILQSRLGVSISYAGH